jgi:hypothetical protein
MVAPLEASLAATPAQHLEWLVEALEIASACCNWAGTSPADV